MTTGRHDLDEPDEPQVPLEQQPKAPKPLRVEFILFFGGIGFFLPVAIIYAIVADYESVGTFALGLGAAMYALVGGYLWLVSRRVDARGEDDPIGDVQDHAGEIGVFSPHSWWPLACGVAAALVFAGVAIGWWMVGIGFAVAIVAIAGVVYEFSRGQHAH